jgi:hypothetical protein
MRAFRLKMDGGVILSENFSASDILKYTINTFDENNFLELEIIDIYILKNFLNLSIDYDYADDDDENIIPYVLENRILNDSSFKQYRYVTNNLDEVMSLFDEYLLTGSIKDINKWEDISEEAIEDENNKIEYSYFDKEGTENIKKILEKSDDEIIKEIINFYKNTAVNEYGVHYKTSELTHKYYFSKGIKDTYRIPGEYMMRMFELERSAMTIFKNESSNEFVKKIISMIDECISYYPNVKKITKARIAAFFIKKGITVPIKIRDLFYIEVNNKLNRNI